MMKGIFLLSLVSIIATPKECLAKPNALLNTGALSHVLDGAVGGVAGLNIFGTTNGDSEAMNNVANLINDKTKKTGRGLRKIVKKHNKECDLSFIKIHIKGLKKKLKQLRRDLRSQSVVAYLKGLKGVIGDLQKSENEVKGDILRLTTDCQRKCIKIYNRVKALITYIIQVLVYLETGLKKMTKPSLLKL